MVTVEKREAEEDKSSLDRSKIVVSQLLGRMRSNVN